MCSFLLRLHPSCPSTVTHLLLPEMSTYDDPIIIEGIITYEMIMAACMTANSLWAAAFFSVKSLKPPL